MDAFSNYYENKIINHLLRNEAFSPPSAIYIALFTGNAAAALEANNPTTEVSFSGTAYQRKAITLSAASNGTSANASLIEWAVTTAGWGTVTYLALVDHPTNTNWGTNVNVLMWGALATPKSVLIDEILRIPQSSITVTVT